VCAAGGVVSAPWLQVDTVVEDLFQIMPHHLFEGVADRDALLTAERRERAVEPFLTPLVALVESARRNRGQ
jgi:hypothetical protein